MFAHGYSRAVMRLCVMSPVFKRNPPNFFYSKAQPELNQLEQMSAEYI